MFPLGDIRKEGVKAKHMLVLLVALTLALGSTVVCGIHFSEDRYEAC